MAVQVGLMGVLLSNPPNMAQGECKMNVVLLRSNDLIGDSRVQRVRKAIESGGSCVSIIAWDRSTESLLTSAAPTTYITIPSQYCSGMRNLFPLLRWQMALFSLLLKRRGEYDAIHACDFDTVLPALLVAKMADKFLVYDMFDYYEEMLKVVPGWIRSCIRWLDHVSVRSANVLILADEARFAQVRSADPARTVIVYNSPVDRYEALSEASPRWTIGYVGLIQRERGIHHLLEAASRHPEWSVCLAGYGADYLSLKNNAPTNATFLGKVSPEEALRIMASSAILVGLYDPRVPNHKYASPNKLFEAMMLAKPIIVSDGSTLAERVRAVGNGFVVDFGDVSALEWAVGRLMDDPKGAEAMGRRGRLEYEKHYSWKDMERRVSAIYQMRWSPASRNGVGSPGES